MNNTKPDNKIYNPYLRQSQVPRQPIRTSSQRFSTAAVFNYKGDFFIKSRKKLMFFAYLMAFGWFSIIFGLFIVFGVIAYYSRELPNPYALMQRGEELSTKITDRNGETIYELFGEKNRTVVTINEISPHLLNATLAIEDAGFYTHQGFDFLAVIRAARNTLLGRGVQGASTLTQQVIKTTLLSLDRTFDRKIKELILSWQLESQYTKDEILQMYLNEVPYGGQNYGVLTASKAYFDKKPSELSVAEAAYLAGLPQSPSVYSHFGRNPQSGLDRKNQVLKAMHERGWLNKNGVREYLSKEDYDKAVAEQLVFKSTPLKLKAPHFVFYVKQLLADKYGEDKVEQGGLVIKTTLDLKLQEAAEKIVYEELEKIKNLNVGNGALVAIQPTTGQILAMVGSKGFSLESYPIGCTSGIAGDEGCLLDPQTNVATSLRQPGSTIKAVTFAAMLAQGYTAAYPFLDVQTNFKETAYDKDYIPENYDGTFKGPMSMRKSLANSLNIPAVKALKIIGIQEMVQIAEKMGISTFTNRKDYGLAITLGGVETRLVELTNAFGVFANKGKFIPETPILEVKTSNGEILEKYTESQGESVFDEAVAFLITDMLSDNGARSDVFGTNSLLNIKGHQVAVKTGTTDEKRDNYAVGYTKDVVVGVWVGNSNNEPMSRYVASGLTGASPIWHNFMQAFLKDKPEHKFDTPSNVEKKEIDSLTGMLPYEDFPRRKEWFIKGTEPIAVSDWYKKIEICEVDGKIANDECRDADKTKTKTFIDIQSELPVWQQSVDAWIGEHYSGDRTYYPPRIETALEFDDGKPKKDVSPKVKIVEVENGQLVPAQFRLNVEVSSPNEIDRVRIYMNDSLITEDKSEPFGYNFNLGASQAGEHTFKAVAEDEDGRKGDDSIVLRIRDK